MDYFKEIGENQFLMEFQKVEDKKKIMAGRLWSFDKSLVALQDFKGYTAPHDIAFSQEHFWVEFHNFPLAGILRKLENSWLCSRTGS